MEAIYTVIVAFSAAFAVMVFLRLRTRLAPLFHATDLPLGGLVTLPAVAFLVVVAAPPSVLVGMLLLSFFGWRQDGRGLSFSWQLGVCAIAAALALPGLHVDSLVPLLPAGVPLPLALFAAWACWLGLLTLEAPHADGYFEWALAVILALTPLAAAPLFTTTPNTIALDAAVLGSALLGGLLGARGSEIAGTSLRWPCVLLLGFLMLRTLATGGWMFALGSLAVWTVFSFWRRVSSPPTKTALNAYDF